LQNLEEKVKIKIESKFYEIGLGKSKL